MLRLLSTVLIAGFAFGCMETEELPRRGRSADARCTGTKTPTTTGFNVIGGTPIDEETQPASRKLDLGGGFCSGTFVSTNVFISASHCVAGGSSFSVKGVRATKAIANPNYKNSSGLENADISVIIFPPNTATSYVPIAARAGKVGDEVTLVGYGPQNVQTDDVGKRSGKTKVTSISSSGMLTVSYQQGSGAISAPGDSGGTVLLDGKLVATMTGGDESSMSMLSHVMAEDNLMFLRSIRDKEKVEICGLDGACGTGGTGGTTPPPTQQTPTGPLPPTTQNPLPNGQTPQCE